MNHRAAVASTLSWCFVSALLGCGSAEPDVAVDMDRIRPSIDAVVMRQAGDSEMPGIVVEISQYGEVIYSKAVGLGDLEEGWPLDTDSIMHIGSVGKQFTAMAVLALVQDGELSLDDTIASHIPELAGVAGGATVRHLLNHTSGIPNGLSDPGFLAGLFAASVDPATYERYASDVGGIRTMRVSDIPDIPDDERPGNADLIRLLAGLPGDKGRGPGVSYEYSNTGYAILGSLIERLSGTTFPEFLESRIFSRIGMSDTFSYPDARIAGGGRVATSYVLEDDAPLAYREDPRDAILGAYSVYSTAEDLLKYDEALYSDALVDRELVALMEVAPRLKSGARSNYGLGWKVVEHKGVRTLSHSGRWLAFTSLYERIPERHLSFVILCNRDYYVDVSSLALTIQSLLLD